MARLPRYLHAHGSLEPGSLYHVTNRGVDRYDIFHSDLDRTIFLGLLADACITTGVSCHAFCLMSNHFHLIVEDSRGLLSLFLHRLQAPYARYFNDTRARRRVGPLFQGRFHADLIDSRQYFDAACAYVLLNPLRTATPLTVRPGDYRWSSAAFALAPAHTTASAFCTDFLRPFGGLEALLAALAPAARTSSRDARRRRFEALASGAWLDRESLHSGRSPEQYCAYLESRRGIPSPFPRHERPSVDDCHAPTHAVEESPLRESSRRTRYVGAPADAILEKGRDACRKYAPERVRQLTCYTLFRFACGSLEAIAQSLKLTASCAERAIERVRAWCRDDGPWRHVLRSVEWSVRWSALAGPWRT